MCFLDCEVLCTGSGSYDHYLLTGKHLEIQSQRSTGPHHTGARIQRTWHQQRKKDRPEGLGGARGPAFWHLPRVWVLWPVSRSAFLALRFLLKTTFCSFPTLWPSHPSSSKRVSRACSMPGYKSSQPGILNVSAILLGEGKSQLWTRGRGSGGREGTPRQGLHGLRARAQPGSIAEPCPMAPRHSLHDMG